MDTDLIEDMVIAAETQGARYEIVRNGQPVAVLIGHSDYEALKAAING